MGDETRGVKRVIDRVSGVLKSISPLEKSLYPGERRISSNVRAWGNFC